MRKGDEAGQRLFAVGRAAMWSRENVTAPVEADVAASVKLRLTMRGEMRRAWRCWEVVNLDVPSRSRLVGSG
jgi:hypothetical protein